MSVHEFTLRLASLFQDHAVLQRDQSLPVWGKGAVGETVVVGLAGHEATTTCGDDGTWLLRLPALPAGGPHELTVFSPSGRVVVRDILIGEVWLCSGQSNMEWKLSDAFQDGSHPSETDRPRIRLLTVTNPATLAPTLEAVGAWKICTPATLAQFSAVGGWFGRALHHELGVPVGLICNAWGGTRIQAWTSRSALVTDAQAAEEVRAFEATVWKRQAGGRKPAPTLDEWGRTEAPQDRGNEGFANGWARTEFDDDSWQMINLPRHWKGEGRPQNGIVWFRRGIEIPADWAGRDLDLHLGAIDKHDDTYVNGERVGGLSWETENAWCTPRVNGAGLPASPFRSNVTISAPPLSG